MLTAQALRTGLHEGCHVAAAVVLGIEVVAVERLSYGIQHGAVIIKGGSDVEQQAFLLAPLVTMVDSVGFDPARHAYDLKQATQINSDLGAAISLVRVVEGDPAYSRIKWAVGNKLNSQLVLSPDDIKELAHA